MPTPPPDPPSPREEAPAPAGVSVGGGLGEIAAVFLKLGFLAFGGPMAHVAMMEDELVRRRHWLSRERFLESAAALHFIPGPNSTELAIHMGYLRGGHAGLLVAGACFIGPAVLVILPLAWLYVAGQSADYRPWLEAVMGGVAPVVLAIIVVAGVRFGQAALRSPPHVALAILAVPLALIFGRVGVQREIAVLALAAAAGAARTIRRPPPALALLALPAAPLAPAVPAAASLGQIAWFFLKVGGTLFGSGYVLVSYLQSGLVEDLGWLTEAELLDAVAVGQTTPGPLLTTSTFVGYVVGAKTAGVNPTVAALVATGAMFLPSFVLVAATAPLLERLRRVAAARAALAAMNAAVVGLIGLVAAELAGAALTIGGGVDPLAIALAVVTLAAMLAVGLNATWLILAGAAAGAARLAAWG